MLIPEADILILHNYLPIYQNYPYTEGENDFPRVDELSGKDEKIIAEIYFRWRNERVEICPSCINEAFSRLMEQLSLQVSVI